jgi:(p)ppGpp synthase/HD superfamily hydrolase
MQRIKQVLDFALVKHNNQMYGNAPYFTHLFGVASRMETESEIIVALLHDVLEDTDCTVIELIEKCKLTDTEILAINLLNKNNHEDYSSMLKEIKFNDLARKVKTYDLLYNLQSSFQEQNQYRIDKYEKALRIINR